MSMEVICLEDRAFYALVQKVVDHVSAKEQPEKKEKWISDQEAMKMLGVKSPTTMQKYRDEDLIRFSQPSRKVILYDRDSIEAFINDNTNI